MGTSSGASSSPNFRVGGEIQIDKSGFRDLACSTYISIHRDLGIGICICIHRQRFLFCFFLSLCLLFDQKPGFPSGQCQAGWSCEHLGLEGGVFFFPFLESISNFISSGVNELNPSLFPYINKLLNISTIDMTKYCFLQTT